MSADSRGLPVLGQMVHGQPLVYLDNAATTQKPQAVIDALTRFYTQDCANVHRGVHLLSERATRCYERRARDRAPVFECRATPEKSSSRAAPPRRSTWSPRRYGRANVRRGRRDPHLRRWSITRTSCRGRCCARRRARVLRVTPIDDSGEVMLDEFEQLLTERARRSSRVAHVSNALGTINPVRKMIEMAHAPGQSGAGGRRAGRAAHGSGCAAAGLRFLRLLRPQDVRADRHRRAVRQGARCSTPCPRGRAAAT